MRIGAEHYRPGANPMAAAALLVLLLPMFPADAARLIVETTTKSAVGEAVRGCLHTVDMAAGEAVETPVILPGAAPSAPLLRLPDSSAVIASSGSRWTRSPISLREAPNFISLHGAAPLRRPITDWRWAPGGWRETAACFAETPGPGLPRLVILAERVTAEGAHEGQLLSQPLGFGPGGGFNADQDAFSLPGAPVKAIAAGGPGRVAVLCRGPVGAGAQLHVRNVLTGRAAVESLDFQDEGWESAAAEPAGMTLSRDGAYLHIAVRGPALDRPGGGLRTTIYTLDTFQFELAAEPVTVVGAAGERGAIQPASPNGLWLATRTPQAAFGYLYRLEHNGDQLSVVWERSYTGVNRPLHLAPSPDGVNLAVGLDDRVDIWIRGAETAGQAAMGMPVNMVRWTEEGLFAGAGNELRALDPANAEITDAVAFQTGHVTDAVLLAADSAAGQRPFVAAAHGQAPDDWGAAAAPLLHTPAVVQFYGEAVGRQMRAVLIDPGGGDAEWRISFDESEMPWLRVHPRSGGAPRGVFYMGVDPGAYGWPRDVVEGVLTVELFDEDGVPAAGSPAEILVRVVPERSAAPRILWILDDGRDGPGFRDSADPHGLAGLARLLGGAPHHFSHRETRAGAADDLLESYNIVVLGARAAARGALTRQAVLDYVAGGGALLFLGEHLDADEALALRRWLNPLGIQIHASERVDGAFAANRATPLAGHWDNFRIENGAGIYVEDPGAAAVPGAPGTPWTVFARTYYGVGHIAMLAASTPLETEALSNAQHRAFAAALFEWLGQSGALVSDLDGDGLPDRLEDRNMDGVVAPGETDPLNPDTDGDGIPDGVEDRNRNARVDPGETNPLNPDSSGSGIWDGADPNPLPPAEAPHIAQVEPWSAPAEGGSRVLVSGRNFTPDVRVFFGDSPAPEIRTLSATALIAELPPHDPPEAGTVDVRVETPALDLEGLLPGGFLYSPRTAVEATLEAARTARAQYPDREGVLSLRISAPPEANIGPMSFLIETDPPGAVQWGEVTPGAGAEFGRRRVQQRPTPTGGLWIDVGGAVRGPTGGVLANAPWSAPEALDPDTPVEVRLERSIVLTPNGAPLDVIEGGAQLPP